MKPSTPMIERIVDAFGVDRERRLDDRGPAAERRPGLEASFESSEISVRVNLPSPQRAAELLVRQRAPRPRPPARGTAPLLERRPPAVPSRPLSYSAISDYEQCGYRFELERVFGFGDSGRHCGPHPASPTRPRRVKSAAPAAASSTLCSSGARLTAGASRPRSCSRATPARRGSTPGPIAARAAARRSGLARVAPTARTDRGGAREVRAEVPLLLGDRGLGAARLDRPAGRARGRAPLVVDYKTDRLGGSDPPARRRL